MAKSRSSKEGLAKVKKMVDEEKRWGLGGKAEDNSREARSKMHPLDSQLTDGPKHISMETPMVSRKRSQHDVEKQASRPGTYQIKKGGILRHSKKKK